MKEHKTPLTKRYPIWRILVLAIAAGLAAPVFVYDRLAWGNIGAVLAICCSIGILYWLWKMTKALSWWWMIVALVIALALRVWLVLDDWDICTYPWMRYSTSINYMVYFIELVGWIGVMRACQYAMHNFKPQQ